jgi:2'-5' RNA ligase
VRAFFAVDLDEGARRAASRAARGLRSASAGPVSWVRPENYHVTLRFLGEIPAERAEALAARAGAAVAPVEPFGLRLGTPRAFPSPRRPRVVVLDLAPEEPLLELARRVEEAVVAAGFAAEERPLRAHLTLGRVRRGGRLRIPADSPAADADFAVETVVLYESELRPEGSHYTVLARLPLTGGASPAFDSPATPEGRNHGQA